jgi:CheY-like chemotaxis protein
MGLRLVVVEDHEALREGLKLLLGREGVDVTSSALPRAPKRASS